MGNYAVNGDVAKRLPTRTLTSGSKPSTGDIDGWIVELEAELDGLLAVAGLAVPIVAARGLSILKAKVVSGVVSRWKNGVAVGTTFEDGKTGDDDWAEWKAWLAKVENEPATVNVMLGGASGSSGGPSRLRSYPTDNADNLSVDAGDFDPPIGLSKDRDPN